MKSFAIGKYLSIQTDKIITCCTEHSWRWRWNVCCIRYYQNEMRERPPISYKREGGRPARFRELLLYWMEFHQRMNKSRGGHQRISVSQPLASKASHREREGVCARRLIDDHHTAAAAARNVYKRTQKRYITRPAGNSCSVANWIIKQIAIYSFG